nr:MAG: putative RNA-dependent RNA polymerase [Picobirnavirus sp.]
MPKNRETAKGQANPKLSYEPAVDYFTEQGLAGARSYFGNVERGQNKVFTTPFAKGETTRHMLDEWLNHLEPLKKEWPSLWNFENDLAAKVGPMSVQKPLSERISDVESYYTDVLPSGESVHPRALQAAYAELKPIHGLRLRSTGATVDNMKLSTNSGTPWWIKRRLVTQEATSSQVGVWPRLGEVLPILTHGRDLWRMAAVLGWRGQEGGPNPDDVKQRVVWMFPFAVNIVEARCYQPLIEAVQKCNIYAPWVSNDAVDERVTELFRSKDSSDPIVCTDFTKFDQHFGEPLQTAANQLLSAVFTKYNEFEQWLRVIYPMKYNMPMIIGLEGDKVKVFKGHHGMGSGSGGTNADETLAHRCLQFEAAIRSNKRLNPSSMCLGDDGILSYPGINVEAVIEAYSSHGLEMNESKQYVSSQDCVFLRRWHHENYVIDGKCVGVYSTCRALGRMRYLERFMDPEVWSKEAVALRQLSILENIKYHPLKEEFVQFCMKRDKYRLGLDIPDFLDGLVDQARKVIDHMPDFLGYTKTLQGETVDGINNWWIVKYLKSL